MASHLMMILIDVLATDYPEACSQPCSVDGCEQVGLVAVSLYNVTAP